MIIWKDSGKKHRPCLIRRGCGSTTNLVFLMRLVLGLRQAVVYSSHGIVLLFKLIGLGKDCLGQSLNRSEENSKLLSTMVEERKLIERGRECLTTLGGNCKWNGFGRHR